MSLACLTLGDDLGKRHKLELVLELGFRDWQPNLVGQAHNLDDDEKSLSLTMVMRSKLYFEVLMRVCEVTTFASGVDTHAREVLQMLAHLDRLEHAGSHVRGRAQGPWQSTLCSTSWREAFACSWTWLASDP